MPRDPAAVPDGLPAPAPGGCALGVEGEGSGDAQEQPGVARSRGGWRDTAGIVGTPWVFLPIGIACMVQGMAQGIGGGVGVAFFVVGVTFAMLALSTGGPGRRIPGTPERS